MNLPTILDLIEPLPEPELKDLARRTLRLIQTRIIRDDLAAMVLSIRRHPELFDLDLLRSIGDNEAEFRNLRIHPLRRINRVLVFVQPQLTTTCVLQ